MKRFKPQPNRTEPAGTQSTGTRAAASRARLRAAALALAALTAAAVAAGCTAPAAPAPAAGGTAASTPASAASPSPAASTSATGASTGTCNQYAQSLKPLPGPPQASAGPFVAAIKARGYLVAGVDANTYKFEYFNPRDGSFSGFDIDMIQAVAHAIFGSDLTGRIQYKAITDDARSTDLQNGSVDIVAHTYTILCSRLKQVAFSTVYFEAHGQILVLDGSTVTGAKDLRGQKVCATKGSDSIANIEPYHPQIVLAKYITDCLVQLQQGQVAAITSDNSILEGLEAQDQYTKIVGGYLTDEPYGLAIAKTHPDFVRFVNAVLAQEEASGAWKASYVKWLGGPAPQPPPAGYAS